MTIYVYYSTTTGSTSDWKLLDTFDDDDLEDEEPSILTINLAGSEISRTRHYRLKIVVSADAEVKLCGVERRYRIIGRSR
jgi:hypothetical protein